MKRKTWQVDLPKGPTRDALTSANIVRMARLVAKQARETPTECGADLIALVIEGPFMQTVKNPGVVTLSVGSDMADVHAARAILNLHTRADSDEDLVVAIAALNRYVERFTVMP